MLSKMPTTIGLVSGQDLRTDATYKYIYRIAYLSPMCHVSYRR